MGLALVLTTAALALHPGDQRGELAFGGTTRSYVLHLPPDFAARGPLPLLLAFHGGGGNAEGFQRYAGLDAPADAHGYAVVYPEGTGRFERRLLTWNAGSCCGWAHEHKADDVGFALALLAQLAGELELDRTRVYATGHSNGAMMAYALAGAAADRIAAIAPVAGTDMTARPAPAAPVAVLHIHSVDDPRAIYAGGEAKHLSFGVVHMGVEATLAEWRGLDHCTGAGRVVEQRSDGGHRAELVDFGPCADGSDVELWRMYGPGHGWPGGPSPLPEAVIGPKTKVISAASEIFAFLPRFTRANAPPLR